MQKFELYTMQLMVSVPRNLILAPLIPSIFYSSYHQPGQHIRNIEKRREEKRREEKETSSLNSIPFTHKRYSRHKQLFPSIMLLQL